MEHVKTLNDSEAYFEKIITAALKIGFITILFILAYLILKPFLVMVLWGMIIAIGIYPLFKKLSSLLGERDKLAAILITLTILALIIFPSVLLVNSTIDSIKNIAAEYEAGTLTVPPPGENVADWPLVGKPIYEIWQLASTNLEEALESMEPQIREYGPKIINSILIFKIIKFHW